MRYPAYPGYKDSGIEWLGEVPAHWTLQQVKHGYFVQLGKMLQTEPASERDEETCYFKSQHVQWCSVRVDDLPMMWASQGDRRKYGVVDGDLLVCEGGDVGRAGMVHNAPEGAIIQNALHRVRSSRGNESRFLLYVLAVAASHGWFEILCNRSTISHFTAEKFGALGVALPTAYEQQLIARFLDVQTAKIDELVIKKRELIEKLKEKRTALISRTVTRGLPSEAARAAGLVPHPPMKPSGVDWLGEVPEHWTTKKLKHLGSNAEGRGIQIGPFGGMLTELLYDDDGPYKVYGQENVLSGDFEKGLRWIDEHQFKELVGYRILPGDILFTRKGSIGGCCIAPRGLRPGIIDSDTIRMRVAQETLEPRFILYAFKFSAYLQAQVQEIKRGAILSGLNTSTIANLNILVPPMYEQHTIVDFLDRETAKIDGMVAKAQQAIERLQEYRTALITAAVTGKIDVREAAA